MTYGGDMPRHINVTLCRLREASVWLKLVLNGLATAAEAVVRWTRSRIAWRTT